MTGIDWYVGILLIVNGCIFYYTSYKKPEKRKLAFLGYFLILIGGFLSVGQWIFNLTLKR